LTLNEEKSKLSLSLEALLDDLLERLNKAKKVSLSFDDGAIRRILELFPYCGDCHIRRQITVARMARSLAQLDLKGQITTLEVEDAMSTIGLSLTAPEQADTTGTNSPILLPEREDRNFTPDLNPSESISSNVDSISEAVNVLDPTQLSNNFSLLFAVPPYPEDAAQTQPEFGDLQYRTERQVKKRRGHGPVIGVTKTDSLFDLSITATVLQAAKFQKIRLKNNPNLGTALTITQADLRSNRRSPKPDKLLILLLDHTCLRSREMQESRNMELVEDVLAGHLRWAYVERARVVVIQVGHAKAANELRAEKVVGDSVLTPRIGDALIFAPGRATPLAHGLSLAAEVLRRSMWQGRNPLEQARLTVLTDGRGNVPISASLLGKIRPPVRRAGMLDSLEQARAIGVLSKSESLRRVETYLVVPSMGSTYASQARSLQASPPNVTSLAQLMNAKLFLVPSTLEGNH
jgi:magnesium chelatase subunit D